MATPNSIGYNIYIHKEETIIVEIGVLILAALILFVFAYLGSAAFKK
jgi:hypothetical protein